MKRIRRWWVRKFRTQIRTAEYNRNAGRILTPDDKPFDFVSGWYVSRPDWWTWGSRSGVTRETVEQALADLDEWQDDMARRNA